MVSTSDNSRITTGTSRSPAMRLALYRRSPATSWYPPPGRGRTKRGCNTPCWRILSANSSNAVSSKVFRGCSLLGTISSKGSVLFATNSSTEFSKNNWPSPLPRPDFLFAIAFPPLFLYLLYYRAGSTALLNHLVCQLFIRKAGLTVFFIIQHRFAVAGGFCQLDAAGDHGVVGFAGEVFLHLVYHLLGQL